MLGFFIVFLFHLFILSSFNHLIRFLNKVRLYLVAEKATKIDAQHAQIGLQKGKRIE